MSSAWQSMAIAGTAYTLRDFPLLWATFPLVVALLLAAAVIALVKRWHQQASPNNLTPGDQLAHFRTLYERGQISAEEFDRIRSLLGERMKKEMDMPASAPPAPSPTAAGERVGSEDAGTAGTTPLAPSDLPLPGPQNGHKNT